MVNKSKPKVLQIITLGILGGAQTHLLDIVHNLKPDFDFHVAIGEPGYLAESLRKEEVAVHIIPSLQRDIAFINDFKAYREIYRLIRSIQPDLVSTHSSKAGFLGRRAAYKLGIPAVFTAHGWAFTDGVDNKRQKLYLRLEKMAARWCNRIICVSEYDRQLALKYRVTSDDKLVTIHNGIPTLASHKSKPENHPLIITMVARFSEQKDHILLLNAVKDIDIKNIKVQLIGDGTLLPNMKSLAKSLRISDRVQFLGNRRDVPELLNQSDIFVLTSKWEGFPISILEAMRAGLPVICSDVGGCREAVEDGENGFLVPRGDGVMLANRLKQLIEDKDLRYKMGQKGLLSFEKYFTVEKMAEKNERIYREIIGF
ncbi:MAG: glycosyltransferase family 4 protein [Syntrophomonadaceae bacterium]|jgi:glycosyltransferase involved in cell wall biosynthesis